MLKLEKILDYVSKHNEFYKKLIEDNDITDCTDITQYPILTRMMLQENRYNMFSDGYKTQYYAQKMIRKNTSGSSCTPLTTYWSYNDYYCSLSMLWRKRYIYYGIRSNDKVVKFELLAFNCGGTNNDVYYGLERNNILQINKSCLISDESYLRAIKVINDFNPTWIYVQPFILRKLLYHYKANNISIPSELRYIESYGEVLSQALKEEAVNFFGVPVANMYGSEEMNAIAYECPFGQMHIFTKNVLVECEYKGKMKKVGKGNAIITSLCNYGMPLVRYNLGDLIEIKECTNCMCGSVEPIISRIYGRERNCLMIEGYEINEYTFTEIIDEINNQYSDAILKYRLIYRKSINQFEFYINLCNDKETWFQEISKSIKKVFFKKMPLDNDILLKVFKQELNDLCTNKFNVLQIIE